MSEVKQYPAWQKEFRAMQAERDAKHEASQQKKREQQAEEAREAGKNLAQALMHFGIYLETPPATNEVEIEGFHFSLSNNGHYRCSKRGDDSEAFDFNLIVAKKIPGRREEDEENTEVYRRIEVGTYNMPKAVGWDYYLCQLADTFDELDKELAYQLQRDLDRAKRAAQREAAPPIESDTEKLLNLLESFIRKTVTDELYS